MLYHIYDGKQAENGKHNASTFPVLLYVFFPTCVSCINQNDIIKFQNIRMIIYGLTLSISSVS